MTRCVNIDWLEVYCYESRRYYPMTAEFFRRHGFMVDEREYGTRQYREMFTIYDEHGDPWLEIRRNPASGDNRNNGIFVPESTHIRLTNAQCYHPQAVDRLLGFLTRFDYEIRRIFRLDICLDFIKFDTGDMPCDFVRRYLARRYAKVNQGSRTTRGQETWSGCEDNYISWGAPKSMVGTKFYNKTKELIDTAGKGLTIRKPWIPYAWWNAGLIDNPATLTARNKDGIEYRPDVWRLEFSLRSSAKEWIIIERQGAKGGKMAVPHTLDLYRDADSLWQAFCNLIPSYFCFRYFNPTVRKDVAKDKQLFFLKDTDVVARLQQAPKGDTTGVSEYSVLLNKLRLLRCTTSDTEVRNSIGVLVDYLEPKMLVPYTETGTLREAEELRRLLAIRTRLKDISFEEAKAILHRNPADIFEAQ